jgi:hypothetical protein
VIYAEDPEDWLPIPVEALVIANANENSMLCHLASCEYGKQVWHRHKRYYTMVEHAAKDGFGYCGSCHPQMHHKRIRSKVAMTARIEAYRRVLVSLVDEDFEDIEDPITELLPLLERADSLVASEEIRAEETEKLWPEGRLVGSTVRLRYEGDGYIGEFRLVAGEDQLGDGRTSISVGTAIGNEIVAHEVGDTFEITPPDRPGVPGVPQIVTLLSVSLPDDWVGHVEE